MVADPLTKGMKHDGMDSVMRGQSIDLTPTKLKACETEGDIQVNIGDQTNLTAVHSWVQSIMPPFERRMAQATASKTGGRCTCRPSKFLFLFGGC